MVSLSHRRRALPLRGFGYFLWEKRWLWLVVGLGAILVALGPPSGFSPAGYGALILLVGAAVLFVTEPIPAPAVALLIVVGQVLFLGRSSTAVAQSLMSDAVLFILGALMLSVAMVKQRLDRRIAALIVRVTGGSVVSVCFGLTLVSGALAALIGEHTVAAMMLPVAITLVRHAANDPAQIRRVAPVLLFSIAYGCAIAAIATPAGAARNAIVLALWEGFAAPAGDASSATPLAQPTVDYVTWVLYAAPVFLVLAPLIAALLIATFRPRSADFADAVAAMKLQLAKEPPMGGRDYAVAGVFALTVVGWVMFSGAFGYGPVAFVAVAFLLITGLVRWADLNAGVNWGVVVLYGALISLGLELINTGAAQSVASIALGLLGTLGLDDGLGLTAAIAVISAGASNIMSNGAAVAVIGPLTLQMAQGAGESVITAGFATAIGSGFAFLSVIGTPACTIIYSSGLVRPGDFVRAGIGPVVLSILVLVFMAAFYWPLLG
ncbi:MAG: SLC13 family permease [Pseudomonadota bacterium]